MQGEGLHIGRRQLFVRFCDCHRACRYCDTPVARTAHARIERVPGSGQFDAVPNPLAVPALLDLLEELNRPQAAHEDLFITGGEPLLQVDFLAAFLPSVRQRLHLPVHLETSGDLPAPLARVLEWIDHVLMDIKLPSVTGEAPAWPQHRAFLDSLEAAAASTTIKLVISADTAADDLTQAATLIRDTGTRAAVVLQPMTATTNTGRGPTAAQVLAWQSQLALALGRGVRVIPQCHHLMGML